MNSDHPINLFHHRHMPIPVLLSTPYALRTGVAVAVVLGPRGAPIGYAPKSGTLTGIPAPNGRPGIGAP